MEEKTVAYNVSSTLKVLSKFKAWVEQPQVQAERVKVETTQTFISTDVTNYQIQV